ncbi:MAG: GNAT family N-acetyltransferase [Planctomycetota bacterium]
MRTLATIRDRGVVFLCGVAMCRVIPAGLARFRRFGVYRLVCLDESTDSPDAANAVQCRPVKTAEDWQTLVEITGYDGRQACPVDCVRGYLAWVDQQCVAGLWLAERSFVETELGLTLDLPDTARWLFSAYVDKHYRRQGIYRGLLRHVLQQHSGQCVYAAISNQNRASLAAHHRFIDHRVATITAAKIERWRWFYQQGTVQGDGLIFANR